MPQLVPEIRGAVQLVSGDHHTVVLTKAQEIFSWGQESLAQLGQGDRTPDPPNDADDAVREPKYAAWKKLRGRGQGTGQGLFTRG